MCRMIFAAGKFDVNWLIDDIKKMASDNNEKHEENENKEFKHSDGWGIAYLDENKLKIFRSVKPIYEDPKAEQFKNLNTSMLILHARYGTKGELNINNIHPFELKKTNSNFIFFHNGTVRDELTIDPEFRLKGETDSEKFFYYLMTGNFGEISLNWLQKRMLNMKNFSGANFILTNGKYSYIANWYSLNPLYYTMKMLRQKESIFISSELLPHYSQADWIHFKNHSLVSIRTSDLNLHQK